MDATFAYAWYGDDFTGSTDAMESLTLAGAKTVLFLKPPDAAALARHTGVRAVGVAGITRSLPPDQLETELRPALNALKALGARGILRPSNSALQVVLGPIADVVSMEIRDALALGGDVAIKPAATVAEDTIALSSITESALGGAANVLGASRHTGRLRVQLGDIALADDRALAKLGIRAIARPAPGQLHVLATDAVLTTLAR